MTFFIIWAIVLGVVVAYGLIHWGVVQLNRHAPDVLDGLLGVLFVLGATALFALIIWSFTL